MAQAYNRDWRIDFWRGLAIAMIFINHIPGNILSILTYKYWGFADAAEVFVFISGLSVAHILTSRFSFNRQGAALYIGYRCFILYIAHLGLFLATAAISAFYMEATDSDAMIQQMALGPFFTQTELAMTRVLSLSYLPTLMDILPLYIVVLAIGGLMFVMFEKQWPLYVAASVTLWAAATYFRVNLPDAPLGRTWFFNPFCWQAVFISGFIVVFVQDRAWFKELLVARTTFWLSVIIVGVGVIAAEPWAFHDVLSTWRPFAEAMKPFIDKQYMSPVRYLHFLASAHLAYVFLRRESAVARSAPGRLCCLIGRNALPAFGVATVLTVCGQAYLDYAGAQAAHMVTVTILGLAGIAAFSGFLDSARKTLRPQAHNVLAREHR